MCLRVKVDSEGVEAEEGVSIVCGKRRRLRVRMVSIARYRISGWRLKLRRPNSLCYSPVAIYLG